MTFTEIEIAEQTLTLENHFWSLRRPPLHLRDKIREGQRFTDQSIELFVVRPAFNRPGEHIEESIAKVTYVRSKDVWHIFWKRADGTAIRPGPKSNLWPPPSASSTKMPTPVSSADSHHTRSVSHSCLERRGQSGQQAAFFSNWHPRLTMPLHWGGN